MEFRKHNSKIILTLLLNMCFCVKGGTCCKPKKQNNIFPKEEKKGFQFYTNGKLNKENNYNSEYNNEDEEDTIIYSNDSSSK